VYLKNTAHTTNELSLFALFQQAASFLKIFFCLVQKRRGRTPLTGGKRSGGLEKSDTHWHVVDMKTHTTEPMNASLQFCPNLACKARGQVGQGNIVVHGRKRPRYKCKTCERTFSAKAGTAFAGLRKPTEVIVIVVTLLAYGCPLQAIVHAFGLDERTVAAWRDRAGEHCEQVHQAIIEQEKLELVHVQADAHPGQSTRDDRLDGAGDDGFHTVVAGRSRKPDTRERPSRSLVAPGAPVLSEHG
jgi:transposase-like protein